MTRKCKKFLAVIFTFAFILTGFFSFGVEAKALADDSISSVIEYSNDSDAKIDGYTIDDIRNIVSNENFDYGDDYLTVYTQDGKMEDVPVLEQIEQESISSDSIEALSIPSFNVRKIVDSGRSDLESIVITFMGDGFTAAEQSTFITAATNSANSLINQYPMSLYKDYFNIYAVEVISAESGVSNDVSNLNDPNNNPSVNNYFGSSYWYDGITERMLYIKNGSKAESLKRDGSVLTVIICNSQRWGGSAASVACSSLSSGYENIVSHEFGHAFANLADEYFWRGREAVNMTKNGNASTIKWSKWIDSSATGIYKIGAFPYGISGEEAQWYRPHQNCKMRFSDSSFCAVCSEEIVRILAKKTGKHISTTDMSNTEIKINDFNIDYRGSLDIPAKINGRYVSIIGEGAFKDCATISSITIPNTVTNIDSNAFENCTGLTTVTLPNKLYAIGTFAFKGCTSLTGITLPESVQHIDDGAFQNCANLSSVTAKKDTASITHLGVNVFKDCKSTLQIIVPANRAAEYKNKVHWSSYSSKIVPNSSSFTSYHLDNSTNLNISTTLSAGKNKLYKLIVDDPSTYNMKATASNNVSIKLYDSNMNHIASALNGTSKTLSEYLQNGTYYYSVEYSDNTSSGTIHTNIAYVQHVHSYEYKVVDSKYHILKCVCGVTSGTKQRHTIDGSYVDPIGNGRYKPCLYCGAAIDTWDGGGYPSILNNQTIYIIFENRLGDPELTLSEMEFINEILTTQDVQFSLNGSYKLNDGTVILVEKDVAAFIEGTLVFYGSDESLVAEQQFLTSLELL